MSKLCPKAQLLPTYGLERNTEIFVESLGVNEEQERHHPESESARHKCHRDAGNKSVVITNFTKLQSNQVT